MIFNMAIWFLLIYIMPRIKNNINDRSISICVILD